MVRLYEPSIPLFPIRRKCMLRYHEQTFTLTSTTGSVSTYVFSANGLYDPNVTGTGHQPMGFDQMMLSYEHYCTLNARIKVDAYTTTSGIACVAVTRRSASTPITVVEQIMEEGNIVSDLTLASGIYGSMRSLQMDLDVAKFGGTDNLLDNDDYRGDVTTNPVEQSYFHIQVWSPLAGTVTVGFRVTIEYEAMFTEPRLLTQSLSTVQRQLEVNARKILLRKQLGLSGSALQTLPEPSLETKN